MNILKIQTFAILHPKPKKTPRTLSASFCSLLHGTAGAPVGELGVRQVNAVIVQTGVQLDSIKQCLGQRLLVLKLGRTVAQFQIGYKGYIQLAIRSGQYKKLNVLAIKEGELIKYDPLNEEIEVKLIENEEEREKTSTIGYYAMFEYMNGFRKTLYWSRSKMEAHAIKYSKGYAAKKGYSFWEKDFDGMAYKTMLRQLISKWGIMSIDMLTALEKDMATIKDNGDPDYVDAQEPLTIDATPIDPETYAEPEETPQPTDNDPLA